MRNRYKYFFPASRVVSFLLAASFIFIFSSCSAAGNEYEDDVAVLPQEEETVETPAQQSVSVIPATHPPAATMSDKDPEEKENQEPEEAELLAEDSLVESESESEPYDFLTEVPPEEENKAGETEAEDEIPDTPPSWLDLYASVFENVRAVRGADRNTFDTEKDPYNLVWNEFDYSGSYIYAYKLLDLDGNGIPELILGNADRTDDFSCDIIYVMFTLVDNKPDPVLYSGARSRKYLSTAGDIYWSGSSGAAWSDYYILDYSGTKTTPVFGCYTSDNPDTLEIEYYKVTGGNRDTGVSELISQGEFSAFIESYEASIVPLTDLIPID